VPKKQLPPEVLKFFQKTGSIGGKTRAAKYTKEELSEMGKKGGRPKGSGNKPAKGSK
jgi:general stress protein YciG